MFKPKKIEILRLLKFLEPTVMIKDKKNCSDIDWVGTAKLNTLLLNFVHYSDPIKKMLDQRSVDIILEIEEILNEKRGNE